MEKWQNTNLNKDADRRQPAVEAAVAYGAGLVIFYFFFSLLFSLCLLCIWKYFSFDSVVAEKK